MRPAFSVVFLTTLIGATIIIGSTVYTVRHNA